MARPWEWDCQHGVGHPKPHTANQVHCCDGCCAERLAAEVDEVVQQRHDSEIAAMPLPRAHLEERKTEFEGGSTRSAKPERYDLIPPEVDECLALRYGLGAVKHGANNWKGGGAEFILSCLNHLRGHYVSLLRNGPFHSDDDIGAMLWNAGALAWFRKHKPEEFRRALGSLLDTP